MLKFLLFLLGALDLNVRFGAVLYLRLLKLSYSLLSYPYISYNSSALSDILDVKLYTALDIARKLNDDRDLLIRQLSVSGNLCQSYR